MEFRPRLSASIMPHENPTVPMDFGRESKLGAISTRAFILSPSERQYEHDPSTASLYRLCALELQIEDGRYVGNHPHSNAWLRTTFKLQYVCNGLITAFVPEKRLSTRRVPPAFHGAVKAHLDFFRSWIAPFLTTIHPTCLGISMESEQVLGWVTTSDDMGDSFEQEQGNCNGCCILPYRYEHRGFSHEQYPELIGSSYLGLLNELHSEHTRARASSGLLRDSQVKLVEAALDACRKDLLRTMPPFRQNRFFELPSDLQQFVQVKSALVSSMEVTSKTLRLFLSPHFRSERLELLVCKYLLDDQLNIEVARCVTSLNKRAVETERVRIEQDVCLQRRVDEAEAKLELHERIKQRWKHTISDMKERQDSRRAQLARRERVMRARWRLRLIWGSLAVLGIGLAFAIRLYL